VYYKALQNRYQYRFPERGYAKALPEAINEFQQDLKRVFNQFFRSFGGAKRVNRLAGL
jgi:hypothetical protein